jgi:hypothetical protein
VIRVVTDGEAIATCSSTGMGSHPNSEERLGILRTIDQGHRWYSLDDKRVCIVCERVFSGRQVEFDPRQRPGDYTAHCPTPGCPSDPSHWFFFVPPQPALSTDGEFSFL